MNPSETRVTTPARDARTGIQVAPTNAKSLPFCHGGQSRSELKRTGSSIQPQSGHTVTETPGRSDDYMKKKKDCRIGERAFEEVERLFKSKILARRVLGIGKNSLYEWKHGTVPSAFYIAKIHYLGGDAMYILTGQRSIENGETRNRRDAVYDGPEPKGGYAVSEEGTSEK